MMKNEEQIIELAKSKIKAGSNCDLPTLERAVKEGLVNTIKGVSLGGGLVANIKDGIVTFEGRGQTKEIAIEKLPTAQKEMLLACKGIAYGCHVGQGWGEIY